jgi:hypothetical protein
MPNPKKPQNKLRSRYIGLKLDSHNLALLDDAAKKNNRSRAGQLRHLVIAAISQPEPS